MDIINDFLTTEMSCTDMSDSIIEFIESFNVRNGEFEGNEYILKKIERESFMIYAEYETKNGDKIYGAEAIITSKMELLKKIELYLDSKKN